MTRYVAPSVQSNSELTSSPELSTPELSTPELSTPELSGRSALSSRFPLRGFKLFSHFVLMSCLVMLSACASNQVISKVKTVPKNSELLIGEFGYWKRDCSRRHFDIAIERYPKGGELRFEVGSLIIPQDPLVGSSGKCVGKEVQSKKVIYVADPGFVGNDSVRYVVKSSALLKDKAYEVDLKVQ